MNSADEEALDRILRALNQAQPPQGMQQRIAQRLAVHSEQRLEQQLQVQPSPVRTRFLHPFWQIAPAAAALLLLLFLSHRLWMPQPEPSRLTGVLQSYPAPTAKVPQGSLLRPGRHSHGAASLTPAHPAAKGGVPEVSLLRPGKQLPPRAQDTLAPEAQLNQPAPPLPLTAQEKLLLRLAHRSDQTQLAALTPASRELDTALDHAQFETFFAPPPSPVQPTQINEDWHPSR